jgi:hypothetical protein
MRAATRRRYWIVSLAAVAAFTCGFVALSACSNYGEGERCEVGNGNDDCQDGLQCTPAAQLSGSNSDRCCPVDRSTATATVCATPSNPIAGDATPPLETGPGADAMVGETSTPMEAGSDADAMSAADAEEGG